MSSETLIAQRTLHEVFRLQPASQMWRNNSGMMFNDKGQPVRFGLGNTSAQINKRFKSSDYIGPVPTLIEPWMVGSYLGVFTALETKESGWTLRPGDERGQAQAAFHDLVRAACGFAGFVSDPERDVPRIIRPWA